MSAEFSRKRVLDRVWSRLAQPQSTGLALLALGLLEALRHWQESDETTMLVRVTAVVALLTGFISTLELLRPRPQVVAALASRGYVDAWWFPFFAREHDDAVSSSRLRWWAGLGLYALICLGIPSAILMSAVQHHADGELMLIPGQGAESFLERYPEPGLRRAMGVKLELLSAEMDGPTPVATVRATDMTTMTATDISLRSAEAQRVRGVLVAIGELRPLGGLGGVHLSLKGPSLAQEVYLRRGSEVTLEDGSVLRWVDSSASRLGTLGPALQVAHERNGELLERRWLYVDFPELNQKHASGSLEMSLGAVERPLAALLSIRETGTSAWGPLAIWILLLGFLLLIAQRLLPRTKIGRDGDYVMLTPLNQRDAVEESLLPELASSDEVAWIAPVDEEDFR